MQDQGVNSAARLPPWGMAALIGIVVLACYWPSLKGEFIWNDSEYVTHPTLRSMAGLGRIWTEPGATEQYYPLLHSAFWVQHRLWGDGPLGYHLVTVLLHAGAAVLFGLVLSRLAVPGAWLAALLFAVHPVHVESVAWITEQKNTLSLVFYLLAALAYLRFDETRRPGMYAAASIIFVLALLCKTVTATLPAALLVIFWWQRGRLAWRREIGPLAPWLALGIAAGLFSSWVERRYVGADGADFTLSIFERCLVAGRACWFYLWHVVWPFDLNFIYARWPLNPAAGWQWLFPVGLLGLTALLWSLRRRTRAPLAAWLFFGGSLLPVLGVVNLYGARYSFVWDHWQYLPDLGPLALLAAGLAILGERLGPQFRVAGLTLAMALVAALAALSWNHGKMFHDNETLYRQTLARNPSCWLAYNNLAFLLGKDSSRLPEAISLYEKALLVKPDYAEAHMNLAGELVRLPGRLPDALKHYEQALLARPGYAEAHYNLANVLAALPGRLPEALAHYEKALQLKPDFAQAHVNLANELAQLPGRGPEALAHYEQALRFKPDLAEAHHNYAAELAKMPDRWPEAVAHFEQALQIEPDFAPASLNLANLLAAIPGRMPEALTRYEQALRLAPKSAGIHFSFANALANLPGRESDALAHYGQALQIRPDFVEAQVNLANLLARMPARQSEAITHYEQALRINPGLARVHYDLAVQLSETPGRAADAEFNYEEALRLKPDYAAAHNNLAILYARQGRLDEARRHWEKALALEPDFGDARRNLELLEKLQQR